MALRKPCLILFGAMLTAAIAACGSPAATPAPTSAPAATPTATQAASPTPTQVAPGPTPTSDATPAPAPTPTPTATPAPGEPVTVTLTVFKDNTLYGESGSLSNGRGLYLFVGNTGQSEARRILVAFDVASAIPAGATILSAELHMHMSKTNPGGSGAEVKLHRVASDWGESTSRAGGEEGQGGSATAGDATWTHRLFQTEQWVAPGGDFEQSPSAALAISGVRAYQWASTSQTVADVQAWLNTPSENFGWLLKTSETGSRTAKRFDSKDNAREANRPRLVVQFTAP